MKKNLITLLSILVVTFVSCSDDNEPGIGGGNDSKVIKEVLTQFQKDYPDATNVSWALNKDNYAIVEYNLPAGAKVRSSEVVRKYKTWYKNEKNLAKIKFMDEKDINYDDLPEAVKVTFEDSKYSDQAIWEIDDVEMISRYNMGTIYSIEVESKNEEVDLYFDEEGVLIREVLDADDDRDKNQGWIVDQTLPDEIKKFLDEQYKGYKIVDIDVEDDDLDEIEGNNRNVKHWEIDLVVDGVKKEAIFNFQTSEWMYTEWEVEEKLPAVILNVIEKDYADFELDDDDEYDMIDHKGKGLLYKVELEYKGKENKKDLLVYFDEKGEVIDEVED